MYNTFEVEFLISGTSNVYLHEPVSVVYDHKSTKKIKSYK
jgi:hypothetical protein